ncbi:MAG: hypothetical protein PHP79_06055 [Clostridia bacterium]|nr:hypothetical protein [Clostridia bacterium]
MRRFIYLDTEVINSYLAQIQNGLIKQKEKEYQQISTTEKGAQNTLSTQGTVGGKILGIGAEGSANYEYKKSKNNENSELVRDIETKIIHDNSFDQLITYLKENDILKEKSSFVGDFVELKDNFFVLDLDYYSSLFSEWALLNYLKKQSADEIRRKIDEEMQPFSRYKLRAQQKDVNKIIKESVQKSDASYDDVKNILDMLKAIVPYRQAICAGEYMVVLDEKYLRDNAKMTAFKYGSKIKIVGYITNLVEVASSIPETSIFSTLQNSINSIMLSFFADAKKIVVVHPIAIFYE